MSMEGEGAGVRDSPPAERINAPPPCGAAAAGNAAASEDRMARMEAGLGSVETGIGSLVKSLSELVTVMTQQQAPCGKGQRTSRCGRGARGPAAGRAGDVHGRARSESSEALPEEFSQAKFTLETTPLVTREEIVRMVSAVYASKGGGKGSKGSRDSKSERVFFAGGSGGGGGRHRNSGGGGGSGGGGSKKKGGGGKKADGASDGCKAGGAGGGDSTMMCYLCGQKGHRAARCATPDNERPEKCGTCSGLRHNKSKCPSKLEGASVVVVLEATAQEGEFDEDVEALACVASQEGKDLPGKWLRDDRGGVGQVRQSERWMADTAATSHMVSNADCLTNFRESNKRVRLAGGNTVAIEGYGDIVVLLPSRYGETVTRMQLKNIVVVPMLALNLISLSTLGLEGHAFTGNIEGIEVEIEG